MYYLWYRKWCKTEEQNPWCIVLACVLGPSIIIIETSCTLKINLFLFLAKSIQSELLPVMATFLVGIMKFMHEFKKRKLPKWLCCCEHLLDISPNISSVVVSFKCMKEVVSIGFDFPLEASIQLGNRKPIWTPYIRDLDLGKNLTHLVDCLLQSLF